MNIELHIEELVLEGFSRSEGQRVGAAVERELARLLAERGLPQGLGRGGEIARMDGGKFEMRQGEIAEKVGGRVAGVVYGGMKR